MAFGGIYDQLVADSPVTDEDWLVILKNALWQCPTS
jgi:hypothetical protein